MFHISCFRKKGFTLIELVVGLAIFAILVMGITSFLLYMNYANAKTKADKEVLENARRAMGIIVYEIEGAKSVYTPTTNLTQLSLETSRYLPTDETITYIDFFLCGTSLCEKREGQAPIVLTANDVQISNLAFTQINNGSSISIKINLTVNYSSSDARYAATTNLTSTATLRKNQ